MSVFDQTPESLLVHGGRDVHGVRHEVATFIEEFIES